MYTGYLYIVSTIVFMYMHYAVFYTVTPRYTMTLKQKSFLITLFSSTVMSTLSLYSNYYLYKSGFNMYYYKFEYNTTNEFLSIMSSAMFTSTLIMDCAIGFFHYHEQMKVISGYVHHIFFIFSSLVVYYYDGYTLLNLFLINELPTVILAAGSVFPVLRNDFLFGTAMFFIRILYHGFLSVMNISYLPVSVASIPSFVVYIHWFKNWYRKYLQ